jgi:N-acetylglucosaminyldiphosphoundecaprenol N-acetyl-beta-D-mannosaminyltransferase
MTRASVMTAALGPKLDNLSNTYTVAGVKISCVNCSEATDRFFRLAFNGTGGYITVTSGHGIVESQIDGRLRRIINNAVMTLADGMPVFWVGRLKGSKAERVSGIEFFSSVMQDPRARRLRHYFYGGVPDSTLRLVARVTENLGAESVAGSHCPPFRAAGALEDYDVISAMQALKPDVIWVGLSTPKQEYWMENHTNYFPQSILIGVGAAFDFHAGVQMRAPPILQRTGLEWLFRLLQDPRRLWPRYKRVVPAMLRLILLEAVQQWASKGRA